MNNKWDTRFMDLARYVAKWSKDPSTKAGAVITRGKFQVSAGFNGFATGVDDDLSLYLDRAFKYDNIIHAEENAILTANQDLNGTTLYSAGAVCSRCTARIIQVGITRVILPYPGEDALCIGRKDWDDSFERAKTQLKSAGVKVTVLEPTGFDPVELMGPLHPSKEHVLCCDEYHAHTAPQCCDPQRCQCIKELSSEF